jgi:hypothetical protein
MINILNKCKDKYGISENFLQRKHEALISLHGISKSKQKQEKE